MKSFKITIFFGDSWNRRESETFTNARPLRGAGALFLSMFCSLHCHVSGCCSVVWVKSLSCWILPSSWLCWRAATCALPSFCWMCLDLFGGSWKAADFLESLFACRNIEMSVFLVFILFGLDRFSTVPQLLAREAPRRLLQFGVLCCF